MRGRNIELKPNDSYIFPSKTGGKNQSSVKKVKRRSGARIKIEERAKSTGFYNYRGERLGGTYIPSKNTNSIRNEKENLIRIINNNKKNFFSTFHENEEKQTAIAHCVKMHPQSTGKFSDVQNKLKQKEQLSITKINSQIQTNKFNFNHNTNTQHSSAIPCMFYTFYLFFIFY